MRFGRVVSGLAGSCSKSMPSVGVRLAGVGQVLVRGRRVPIVGSVCMDSVTIDVTNLEINPGDDVVLIGSQGHDRIDAAEMAGWIGTVPHEILCRTGSRIQRVYAGGDPDESS